MLITYSVRDYNSRSVQVFFVFFRTRRVLSIRVRKSQKLKVRDCVWPWIDFFVQASELHSLVTCFKLIY